MNIKQNLFNSSRHTLTTTATAALQDLLKNFYIGPITVQIDEESGMLYSAIAKDGENISGAEDQIRFPLMYGRAGSVSSIGLNDTTPSGETRRIKQAVTDTKNLVATLEIHEKMIMASRDMQGAFMQALPLMMENLMTDVVDNNRRQIVGDGTGEIGTVSTVGANTTLSFVTTSDPRPTRGLYEGMLVDVYNAADSAFATGGERRIIENVDHDSNQITLDANVTSENGSHVYIHKSKNNEMEGLQKILTKDNTLYGIDRSANKWFNPIERTGLGNLSETAMQQMIDDIHVRSGKMPDMIYASQPVGRSYQNLVSSFKRNMEYMDLGGGRTAMSYNKIPIELEKYMEAGTMYFLTSSMFKMHQMGDWDWMNRDGAILSRISQRTAYEATLLKFCNLGCYNANANAALRGITEQ